MTRFLSALLLLTPSARSLAPTRRRRSIRTTSRRCALEVEPPADFKGKRILIVAGQPQPRPRRPRVLRRQRHPHEPAEAEPGRLPDHGPRRLAEEREALRHRRLHRDVHGRRRRPPGDRSPERMEVIQKQLDRGCGWVNMHYAVEYPVKAGDRDIAGPVKGWLGGYYETGYSINPHWDAMIRSLPKHPITRGVKPFTIRDEWYYNMRWVDDMKGVTPILQALPPDNTRSTRRHEGAARARSRRWPGPSSGKDGGRSFGFTGGHFHRNWADEDFRRLVVNAILWCAKVDVPRGGREGRRSTRPT